MVKSSKQKSKKAKKRAKRDKKEQKMLMLAEREVKAAEEMRRKADRMMREAQEMIERQKQLPFESQPDNGMALQLMQQAKKMMQAAMSSEGMKKLQESLKADQERLKIFILEAKRDFEAKREAERQEWQERRAGRLEQWSSGKRRTSIRNPSEGYYEAQIDEIVGEGQLQIEEKIGEGMFSSVFKAKAIGAETAMFAVKFVRTNEMMRRASEREVRLMKWLSQKAESDQEGAQFLMRLAESFGSFEHQGHFCLCFNLMRCDMRTALGKYGKPGFRLSALQRYGKQMFLALRMLRRLGVIHSDLKPDNLLLSMDKESVQISDFGSAMRVGEVLTHGYVAPRVYRPPEVILGCKYDASIDVWAAGCTLFELATGLHLFTGKTNALMLKQHLEFAAPCTERLKKTSTTWDKYFDETGLFHLPKENGNEGRDTRCIDTTELEPATAASGAGKGLWAFEITQLKPLREELDRLLGKQTVGSAIDLRARLCDMLVKLLKMDPMDRLKPDEVLRHEFFHEISIGAMQSKAIE